MWKYINKCTPETKVALCQTGVVTAVSRAWIKASFRRIDFLTCWRSDVCAGRTSLRRNKRKKQKHVQASWRPLRTDPGCCLGAASILVRSGCTNLPFHLFPQTFHNLFSQFLPQHLSISLLPRHLSSSCMCIRATSLIVGCYLLFIYLLFAAGLIAKIFCLLLRGSSLPPHQAPPSPTETFPNFKGNITSRLEGEMKSFQKSAVLFYSPRTPVRFYFYILVALNPASASKSGCRCIFFLGFVCLFVYMKDGGCVGWFISHEQTVSTWSSTKGGNLGQTGKLQKRRCWNMCRGGM